MTIPGSAKSLSYRKARSYTFVVGAHTETTLQHKVFMAVPAMPLHIAVGHLLQRGAMLLLISLYKQGQLFCSPGCTSTIAPGISRASSTPCGVRGLERTILYHITLLRRNRSRLPAGSIGRDCPTTGTPLRRGEHIKCQGASAGPSGDLCFHGHTDATVPSCRESPTGTRTAQPNQEPCMRQAREARRVHPTAPHLQVEKHYCTHFACQRSASS